jgi:16S rRNA pseudouridine516 synthase
LSETKRLDRFLTECFEISRSVSGKVIRAGQVSVNGKIIRDASFKTEIGDEVEYAGQRVEVYDKLYYMLNKPDGCVCANDDSHNPVVFVHMRDVPGINSCHCVGRLDLDTTGLLLVTNDGQWSHRISSPKKHLGKTYRVMLADPVTEELTDMLRKGILLAGEKKPTSPAEVEIRNDHEIDLVIYEGKYHQVKRMIQAGGNQVVALHRIAVGPLALDPALEEGQYRRLRRDEIELF